MSKGNFAFKETDLARAARAALKAGLKEFTVRVTTRDGVVFEIRSGQTNDEGDPAVNEWEDWSPHDKTAA
jgi:hypothetical protein